MLRCLEEGFSPSQTKFFYIFITKIKCLHFFLVLAPSVPQQPLILLFRLCTRAFSEVSSWRRALGIIAGRDWGWIQLQL